MGNIENLFEVEMGLAINLPTGAYVVANESDIQLLAAMPTARSLGPSALVALPLDSPVPPEIVAKARVLVLEVDPANPASLRRIAQVRAERHDLPIIAAIHDANVMLMRTIVRH